MKTSYPEHNVDSMARRNRRMSIGAWLTRAALLFAMSVSTSAGKTIYVDDDATGANNGTSWQSAYTFLQEALADARMGEMPVEIRVAQGIYKPNEGLVAIPEFDWREATFRLVSGVALKGGYAGLGAPDPNARDVEHYRTILSGDLNGDDVEVAGPEELSDGPSRAENSYHVVTGDRAGATTVLSGFTITGGNADGPFPHNYGGGLYNYISSPALDLCIFSRNSAGNDGGGGAMYNMASWPSLTDCVFEENSAGNGGGILNDDSGNTSLSNCIFSRNTAERGGAVHNYNSNPTVAKCIFSENSAYYGGGLYNYGSSPMLSGCTFSHSSAVLGGAIYGYGSGPTLTNCTFSGSSATTGAALYNYRQNSPILFNCTFVGNSAVDGNTLTCFSVGQEDSATVTLTSCILWNGGHEISNNGPSVVEVSYSDVQGGWPGEGNINADPLFASAGYWRDANDPYLVVEPNDPNAVWVDGNYLLKSQAGRWDPVSQSWIVDDVTSPCIDAGDPNSPVGDEPEPNGGRVNMGAYGGTPQASKSYTEQIVTVQWLGHSTVKIWTEGYVVYVDPERVPQSLHDADLVCVTHTHGDHYSPSDIANVSNGQTQFIGPPDVVQRYGSGQSIAPGQTIDLDGVRVIAVPAYNTNKPNHPRSNNWVGYIIELGGRRVYVAGDTDLIEEMKSLGHIDVAFLPAGGTYTMNAVEAAEATQYIRPGLAIPYHWGQIVGTLSDAQRFAELARSAALVLAVSESISSDKWPEYSPLIAHWALDESEGDIAHDTAGDNDAGVQGGTWRAGGGKVGGAIELDGGNDYVVAGPVLNPAEGPFSVFAWVRGGAPGQVVISQAGATGRTWLGADLQLGTLMTGLVAPPAGRYVTQPLVSDSVVTDGSWHHVGFTWDVSIRRLYVDGAEVAADTTHLAPLQSSDGGLNIGVGEGLAQDTLWMGLIDDVRIYNLALTAAEIREIAQ